MEWARLNGIWENANIQADALKISLLVLKNPGFTVLMSPIDSSMPF